jgi:transcriptional regulator with GAF, ATPase, and Fis domain
LDEATRETGHRRLLGGLVQLARTCHASLDSARLMEAIMDCLLGLCKAERGFILAAVQPPGREATLVPGKGDFVAVVTRKINPTGSDAFSRTLASRVLATGKPLLIEDTSADGNLNTQESVLAAQIRSVLAAPLLKGNAAVGVIYLDCHSARRVFSQEDLHVLEAAAEHVVGALEVSRERDRLRRQTACLQQVVGEEVRREYDFQRIVGKSAAMVKVLEAASAVAPQDTTVLILGESGTGKELIARAIHDLSRRCQGLFVAVNCMALASSVLESELFGHEKGAFTGATARHVGRFEVADGARSSSTRSASSTRASR